MERGGRRTLRAFVMNIWSYSINGLNVCDNDCWTINIRTERAERNEQWSNGTRSQLSVFSSSFPLAVDVLPRGTGNSVKKQIENVYARGKGVATLRGLRSELACTNASEVLDYFVDFRAIFGILSPAPFDESPNIIGKAMQFGPVWSLSTADF